MVQQPPSEGATQAADETPPPPPTDIDLVIERFPGSFVPSWRYADQMPTVRVMPEHIREAISWLRRECETRYDMLVDVGGSHWPDRDEPFEVTYILHSMSTNARIRVKCAVAAHGGELPVIPSIALIWSAANWPEREIYDMFGVEFTDHPDLRRILTPNDWEGHPLLKDFPLGEEPVEFYRSASSGV